MGCRGPVPRSLTNTGPVAAALLQSCWTSSLDSLPRLVTPTADEGLGTLPLSRSPPGADPALLPSQSTRHSRSCAASVCKCEQHRARVGLGKKQKGSRSGPSQRLCPQDLHVDLPTTAGSPCEPVASGAVALYCPPRAAGRQHPLPGPEARGRPKGRTSTFDVDCLPVLRKWGGVVGGGGVSALKEPSILFTKN